jgi:hypothetical protein
MFGWFAPTCPVDPCAKAWIERRFAWLIEQFGLKQWAHTPMIVPHPHYFPDAYDQTRAAAQVLLGRVCNYMKVTPTRVSLEFYSEANRPPFVDANGYMTGGAAGLYQQGRKHRIMIENDQLLEPMHLVGTMSHELSHARLLGEGRVSNDEYDHELLTDLNVVFHGLGIFLANAPRHWDGNFTRWPGTELKKPEYMTLPMLAYALGLWSWLRDEPKPFWLKHLRIPARSECKEALRYLFKTQDTTLRPVKNRLSEWFIDTSETDA